MQRLMYRDHRGQNQERSARPRYRTRKNQKQHTDPQMMCEWHRRSLSTVNLPIPSHPVHPVLFLNPKAIGRARMCLGRKRDKKTKMFVHGLEKDKEKNKNLSRTLARGGHRQSMRNWGETDLVTAPFGGKESSVLLGVV